jgi:hypothetical protein
MEKRGGMDNENKFYNIYRLWRKEGAWTTRTSSTIDIYIVELVLVVHVPSFLHGIYML